MGVAPISPLAGALPWATRAIGEGYGSTVWHMVAGASTIATAVTYIGYAKYCLYWSCKAIFCM